MNKILTGAAVAAVSLSTAFAAAPDAIVIYYSRTGENYAVGNIKVGNTAKVAQEIARVTGAPLYEIKDKVPYPAAYDACVAQAKKEVQSKARPAFAGNPPDLSKVTTIYLGYPNWWGDCPMVVYTLLEALNLEGKTVYLFCTHEGSGLGSTARKLAAALPKAKVEPKGLALYGHVAQNDPAAVRKAVADWLKSLGRTR